LEISHLAYCMDLSVIIVNWNSVDFLGKCLASVYAISRNISFEVIVVDNASFDGSEGMIRKQFPHVMFIQSRENLGFAKGNNLGFEHSCGRGVLFLNPDTEIVGASLEAMVVSMDSLPDAGALGPRLLNSDLTVQTSCLQAFPSILNQLVDFELLRQLFPNWSLWGNRILFEKLHHPAPVEAISGACLLVKRNVFEAVRRFTPDYFMYAEDMDLCYKIRNAGWKNYYLGNAEVIHHGGQSSTARSDKQFSAVTMRESLLHFMRIHHGRVYAQLFRWTTGCMALSRMCILAVAIASPWTSSDKQSLSLAFLKWRRVFRWALGLETWAKIKPATP
jgi:GT2 family glycosyltransferase